MLRNPVDGIEDPDFPLGHDCPLRMCRFEKNSSLPLLLVSGPDFPLYRVQPKEGASNFGGLILAIKLSIF